MLRAAEAEGLAGFAFTEHVFHIEEARAASRYLGTRWDGELEGPADRRRALPERDRAGSRGGPCGGRRRSAWSSSTGPTIRCVREAQDDLHGGARRRPGTSCSARCTACADDHSIFDPAMPLSAAEAWDDYLERLGDAVEHGGYDVVTHPVRLAVSRPEVPSDLRRAARPRWPSWRPRATPRSRSTAPTCASSRSSCSCCASRSARAGARASLGSDAHYPRSVGAVLAGVELLRAAGVRHAVAFERGRRRDVRCCDAGARRARAARAARVRDDASSSSRSR